ncbi:4Fe-4S dicluster domain-containing protein, partial [Dysosmobacter welbionis]
AGAEVLVSSGYQERRRRRNRHETRLGDGQPGRPLPGRGSGRLPGTGAGAGGVGLRQLVPGAPCGPERADGGRRCPAPAAGYSGGKRPHDLRPELLRQPPVPRG